MVPPAPILGRRAQPGRAFTLIETIIVVAILALLIALAAVAYDQIRNTAHDRATEAKLSQIAKAGLADRIYETGSSNFGTIDADFITGSAEGIYGEAMTLREGDEPSTAPGVVSLAIGDTSLHTRNTVATINPAYATGDMVALASLSPSGNCSFAILTANGGQTMWSGEITDDSPCMADEALRPLHPHEEPLPGGRDNAVTDPGSGGGPSEEGEVTDPPLEGDSDPGEADGTETGEDDNDTPAEDPTTVPVMAAGPFDRAVFSESSMGITNTFRLLAGISGRGGLYTGGDFACNSDGHIDGNLLAGGTMTLTNGCSVTGDASAGGDITTSTDTVNIGGTLRSQTGDIRFGNAGLTIGTGIEAGGRVISNEGTPVTPLSGAAVRENVSTFPPLPVETMPIVTHDPARWPEATAHTWAQMVNASAEANNAPKWSSARDANTCAQLDRASYSLNGPLTSPAHASVVNALGCSQISLNSVDLHLRGDLTIFATAFTSSNGLRVSTDGGSYTLRIIIPFNSSSDRCAPAKKNNKAPTLTFNSGGTTVPATVKVLLYSAGNVRLTNSVDMHGQIYGCHVSTDSATTVRFARVAPPGY